MIPGIAEQVTRMAREHREDQERRAARNDIVLRQKRAVKKLKCKPTKEGK